MLRALFEQSARVLRYAVALLTLAGPAAPTWSIVCVNMETGEVCVASATCITDTDLERFLPVIRVGRGAGAAQSAIDSNAENRMIIWTRLNSNATPRQIIQTLGFLDDNHESRQYGLVNMSHEPMTFTGHFAGHARHGVSGQVDSIKYAIQGNVLTGDAVVMMAEIAFRETAGDLSQRVMAAMEAARVMGGDGRCSCNPSAPQSCGCPPPAFHKTCHVAFIQLARVGDPEGVCNVDVGCANGDYYLDRQITTSFGGPDPVRLLFGQYEDWRALWHGRPDHLLSTVHPEASSLVADGTTYTVVRVALRDIEGEPLMDGGAQVRLQWGGVGEPTAISGPVSDHGDGTYSFRLTATETAGEGAWRISVDDGLGAVRLYPDLALRTDPVSDLHAGADVVSAAAGADVAFVLNLGSGDADRPYLLLGSASGTAPGQVFHQTALALNRDGFFLWTLTHAGSSDLPRSVGRLDAGGRSEAHFVASPADLAPFVGQRLDWAAVVGGGVPLATSSVGFEVVP